MSKVKLDKNQPITRAFQLPDIRANGEDGRIIEGHAAVYDQRVNIANLFYEEIARGAFEGTNFDDVLFSVNHDLRKIPLARSRRNNENSTLQLNVDEQGLKVRADMDTENNSQARSLYSAVSRGDIDGMSFIFYVGDEEWRELESDMPTRRITRIDRVIEVTAANFPAYSRTDINARQADTLDNAKKALDNARSKQGLDNPEQRADELEILKLKNEILAKG